MSDEHPLVTLSDIAARRRQEKRVYIRSLGGDVVLQEFTAADALWVATLDGPNTVKARIALMLKEPCLGVDREAKIVGMELLIAGGDKREPLTEPVLDELFHECQAFQQEATATATQQLQDACLSIPGVWKIMRVLAEKRGWLKDLDDVTESELTYWCNRFEPPETSD